MIFRTQYIKWIIWKIQHGRILKNSTGGPGKLGMKLRLSVGSKPRDDFESEAGRVQGCANRKVA